MEEDEKRKGEINTRACNDVLFIFRFISFFFLSFFLIRSNQRGDSPTRIDIHFSIQAHPRFYCSVNVAPSYLHVINSLLRGYK